MPKSRKWQSQKKKTSRAGIAIAAIVIIAAIGGVAYLITQSNSGNGILAQEEAMVGQPIPSSLYNTISSVSISTISGMSTKGVAALSILPSGTPLLTYNGKPEVLYIGAEYCPFCAAERWGMVVALSKFGNFSNLSYMLSSPTDPAGSNVPTFTFYGSNYTSQYISFIPIEETNRYQNVTLQTPTPEQQNLMYTYDPNGNIPFIDIANRYILVGAQFSPSLFQGLNWTQIASQLDNPDSSVAKAVDASANTIITAICSVDGGNPATVCSSFSYSPASFQPVTGVRDEKSF
ncbi:MAG: DUF929 family protein [Conexivisphaerales archaeon]